MSDSRDPQSTRRGGASVLSWAEGLDRSLTWGLEPAEREEILCERRADRFDHLADPDASMTSVVARSALSALSDVWYRFVGGDASALPLAVLLGIVGIGALADAFTPGIPAAHGALNVVTGIGFLAMAAAGIRQPRKLQRAWLLPGLVLAAVGTMGGAIMLPPMSDAGPFGWFAKLALAGVATGLTIVAFALIRPNTDRSWIVRGGTIIWGSALSMAVGAIGWTIVDAPIYSTRWSSLMVAAACVVGAAVITRLRNIEVAA